jgi:hypothetical protein
MTMNEPGRNPPRYEGQRHEDRTRGRDNTWTWVIGALAALAVLGGIFWATSNRTSTVADRPAATSGATTGTVTPRSEPVQPTNPAGNTQTAPSPPAPTNR